MGSAATAASTAIEPARATATIDTAAIDIAAIDIATAFIFTRNCITTGFLLLLLCAQT